MVKNLFSKATHVTLGSIQPLQSFDTPHFCTNHCYVSPFHTQIELFYKKGDLHQYFFMHQITEKEEEMPQILQSE